MRLYLDTNILIYMLADEENSIDGDTWALLTDPENLLYTSVVCVQELIYLKQKGKVLVEKKRYKGKQTEASIVDRIKGLRIEITPFNELHLRQLEQLPLLSDKCDPTDRQIIAQAIADKATLVSTDKQFPNYADFGLKLHQNLK
ncbi:MAG: PIN domain-containing protein [Prevotella sp.]|nr:PIN domain-containing protein [Prevotella sp.]MCD8289516.1 PIN domain-containing protein [Prevotella sp.]